MNKSAEQLTEAIHAAFRNHKKPDAASLMSDNSGYHLECEEIRCEFQHKTPFEITPEKLRYHKDALPFFSPEAMVYFLPAYLIALIHDYEEMDTAIYSVAGQLTPELLISDLPAELLSTPEGAELSRMMDEFRHSGYQQERAEKNRSYFSDQEWQTTLDVMTYLESLHSSGFIGESPMARALRTAGQL